MNKLGLVLIGGLCACGQESGVTIEYIAHAAFLVSSGETTVLIDPYASRVWLGYDFPEGVEADAILITHPHYDHDAGEYRGMPFPWGDGVRVLREPGEYTVGDLTISGIQGKHADPYGKEFGQINTIWVVEAGGMRIVHVGDNGPLTAENVRSMGDVDFLMMPIDAVYHILAEDEIQANISAVQPRFVVPMHYRIPELETSADSPSDLGPIDPWLDGKRVWRLPQHRQTFTRDDLNRDVDIIVFPHSPSVPLPAKDP